MSPLVRSLLALAALLATAASQESSCKEASYGTITNSILPLQPVHLNPPGGILDIKDFCGTNYLPGTVRVGEHIKACNNDLDGYPPVVYEDPANQLEWVRVVCPDGCPKGVTVYVTEYCSY